MIVRVGLSALALLVVAAVAGCGGTKTLNTENAERQIKRGIEQQTGADVRSVSCPDDVKAEKGRSFTCNATGADGTKAAIDVEQTNDEGGIHFSAPLLHTGTAETEIAEGIEKQTGASGVSVECPDLVVAKAGTKLTCRATSGGDEADVAVTVEDAQGRIRWQLKT